MRRSLLGGGAAALAASCLLLALVAVVFNGVGQERVVLWGSSRVFDSNTPVQWDSKLASTDITGLSRYYRSAGAELNKIPEARTLELAEVPQTQGKGVAMWSTKHRANVAHGALDKSSVKGIWHSDTEAWKGIDELFPTDTRYAFEEDHQDSGETAKMKTFIDHVRNQLKLIEDKLPKQSRTPKERAEVSSLTHVLDLGKSALAKIELQVQLDGGAHHAAKAAVPQLSQVVAHKPKVGLRADYVSDKSARNDIDSYFDQMDQMTEKENERNARASGNIEEEPKQVRTHKLSAVPAELHVSGMTARAFASEFATQLSAALAADAGAGLTPADESESCKLCVKIFGCMDCCEPVCSKVHEAPAAAEDKKAKQVVSEVSKQLSMAGHETAKELHMIEKQLSSIAKASTAAHTSASLSRAPCECKSDECKECPDEAAVRSAHKKHLSKEKKVLSEAERAVAKSNAILQERIAALEATNEMAIKQGLGAYGPESSEEVWPAREPTPGKSEQIASGASDVIKELVNQVAAAQAKAAMLKVRLEQAEKAAAHGAEVTAEQRHLIGELAEQLNEQTKTAHAIERSYVAHGLSRYGGSKVETEATESLLPFYEQPAYGGDKVFKAVKFFERHPNQVKADIGPHPLISQD